MNILEYSRDKKYLDRIKKLIGKFITVYFNGTMTMRKITRENY